MLEVKEMDESASELGVASDVDGAVGGGVGVHQQQNHTQDADLERGQRPARLEWRECKESNHKKQIRQPRHQVDEDDETDGSLRAYAFQRLESRTRRSELGSEDVGWCWER